MIKTRGNIRLKLKRIERGMNQQEVAEELGIDRSSYAFKEGGFRSFKEFEITKILKLFDCTYDELFGTEEKSN
jgi:transcriptional regulator with XRE-family HTH domain